MQKYKSGQSNALLLLKKIQFSSANVINRRPMKNAIKKMQANSIFRTLSSVKMAVPVLLTIAAVVAVGTLYESRYNAEYARLMVYQTVWFELLLGLLGLNIFLATLSRLPWRKGHLGFLITHLGMITLLAGSWVTKYYGIDGQLYVLEGQESRDVALDSRVIEMSGHRAYRKVGVDRTIKSLNSDDLKPISTKLAPFFEVVEYRPFVVVDPALYNTNEEGVSFRIKSPFFDETLRLTGSEPEIKMGPATIRLVRGEPGAGKLAEPIPTHAEKKMPNPHKASGGGASKSSHLVVTDRKSSKVLREIPVDQLRRSGSVVEVGGVEIQLKKIFERAIVAENSIADGGPKHNPAVEIEVKKDGKSYREVLFARFPDFSMTENNNLGVSFAFVAADESAGGDASSKLPPGHPPLEEKTPVPTGPVSGNLMEFRVASDNSVELALSKNGEKVLSQPIAAGQTVPTPWMNMQITLLSVGEAGDLGEPQATEPTPKTDRLPPSAVKVQYRAPEGKKSFWLVEGQSRTVADDEEQTEIYYGREIIRLPFRLRLEEFHKKDYPGTETAMSFESKVKVDDETESIVVSMNEPLYRNGYTLYQASYEIGANGGPDTSVFSVNRDAGRAIKYLGSLITALGIIIFTLSRSRLAKKVRMT